MVIGNLLKLYLANNNLCFFYYDPSSNFLVPDIIIIKNY